MNTPALESLKTNLLSIKERNALQSLIDTLEKSSSKSAIDIYNTAVYQLIKNGGLSEGALTELRTIKKGLDNGAPKYTREYIMAQLGITIPDRATPVEIPVDKFITKRKITQKPKIKVRDILNSDADSGVRKKSANHKGTPSQKWVRIAETPRKAVAKIPEAVKTPEEVEKHTALILYLQEDFLNHSEYFPSIIEVSFDKHGCPIILQTYRERLSGMMQKGMVNLILDKVGDFIFKKTIIQQK